jgi:hypothetical protein
MVAVGDRVVVESEKVGSGTRSGVVTAVEDRLITVRWDSGSESVFVPSAGSLQVTGHEPPLERPTVPERAESDGRSAHRGRRSRHVAAFNRRHEAATLHACSLTSLLGRWRQATPVTMLPPRARRAATASGQTTPRRLLVILIASLRPGPPSCSHPSVLAAKESCAGAGSSSCGRSSEEVDWDGGWQDSPETIEGRNGGAGLGERTRAAPSQPGRCPCSWHHAPALCWHRRRRCQPDRRHASLGGQRRTDLGPNPKRRRQRAADSWRRRVRYAGLPRQPVAADHSTTRREPSSQVDRTISVDS